jgi:leucyl-tRNA synthetase
LGHGRTYLIPDIVARYKRMRGYNVLFPMAFHFTGTPILTATESLLKREENLIKEYRELYEVSEEDIEKIKTPHDLASYFKNRAENDMKNYLLSIDWRRKFTTVDPEYKSFIRWQFAKLKEKNYIVKGTHPVGWCPKHQMPVGMHDTKGDVEPEIEEFTLIFFLGDDGIIFPAATLRPETVFGAVNLWVNPASEYVIANIDGKEMILSSKAYRKITFQKSRVEPPKVTIKGEELVGRLVLNPITRKKVPVLPASFVDEDYGTGVVMSVPAHAPYDYVALMELRSSGKIQRWKGELPEISPLKVISLNGYSEFPAADVVKSMGIKSTSQRDLLEKATKDLYFKEYSNGLIDKRVVELAGYKEIEEFASSLVGRSVKEARELVTSFLKKMGKADSFYEIANKPVYCRCGTEIVVKVVENQWFIDYENEEWKKEVRRAFNEKIEVIPEEYKSWFMIVIDWLKKRACARSRGMGTSLPWDESWIIESLSDSTIYMAFYTVILKIRELSIQAEKLDEKFWDYIFLGKGSEAELSEKLGIDLEKIRSIREEFLYWYPLDNRHSGKDLVPNHLTFMVFNHVAIFPEELWPKRIVVNGHIMVEGEKMSKSLGNFIPLFKAIREVGPNSLRLALTYSAEIGNDANYGREIVPVVHDKLKKIAEIIDEIQKHDGMDSDFGPLEKWITSTFRRRVAAATEAMEKYAFREASIEIYFKIEQDLRRYLSAVNIPNWAILKEIAEQWTKLMVPITPAFAEELWHKLKRKGSVTIEEWPSAENMKYYPEEELAVLLVDRIEEDIENIKRALKREPKGVVIVTADSQKWEAVSKIFSMLKNGSQAKDIVKEIAKAKLGQNPNEAASFLYELYQSLPKDLRDFIAGTKFEEFELLNQLSILLSRELKLDVKVLNEQDKEASQYILRRKPMPLRPAINLIF